MSARLRTGFWARALLRRVAAEGRSAMVVARGDEDAGGVLVIAEDRARACAVLTLTRDASGTLAWHRALGPVTPPEAQAHADRQRGYDPDLWVIEIEVRDLDHAARDLGTPEG